MTSNQLLKIKEFSKNFYLKTGEFHGWDHITFVKRNALKLAKNYKKIDLKLLEAACYLHDIGRSVKDDGHPQESVRLSQNFLRKIKLSPTKIAVINDAVSSHDKSKILKSKTLEARLLFDADKLDILSVRGFLRVLLFLIEERKMDLDSSFSFLWKYVNEVNKKYLYTKESKNLVKKDIKIINAMAKRYKNCL